MHEHKSNSSLDNLMYFDSGLIFIILLLNNDLKFIKIEHFNNYLCQIQILFQIMEINKIQHLKRDLQSLNKINIIINLIYCKIINS